MPEWFRILFGILLANFVLMGSSGLEHLIPFNLGVLVGIALVIRR